MPPKKKDRTEAEIADLHARKLASKRKWYRNKQALLGKEVAPRAANSPLDRKERIAGYNRKQRERRKLLGVETKYVYKRKKKITPVDAPKRVVQKLVKPEPKVFEKRVDDRTVEVKISEKLTIMVRPGTDIEAIKKKYANK